MGVAATSTEAAMNAIQKRLVQLNVMLGRIATRQDQMLEDLKKKTAALTPTTTTTPTFVPGRVLEQQTTRPSSPLLFSANQVVRAGAPQADAVFASTTPTRCSTLCSAVNTLQGVVEAAVKTPTGCSTHVLSCPPDDPGARALEIDTDMPDEVMTLVGGLSLFIQLVWDSSEEIFNGNYLKGSVWDEAIPDEVLTHVGGLSLFKELDLDTHMEFEECVVQAEEAADPIWVTPSQWNMVFSVTPPCGQSALAPRKPGLGGAHGLFDKAPPWESNAFHPGNFATRGDHLLLNKIPSWQRSAFSPGNSEIRGADYVFVQAPPWGTNATMALQVGRAYVWEDIKSKILAPKLCFQGDPGIMLNALIDAMSGIGKVSTIIHLAQESVYLHLLYLQVMNELGKCIIVLMYVSAFSAYLEICLASHLLYKQWDYSVHWIIVAEVSEGSAVGLSLHDRSHLFYSNHQSKLHAPKSELMWPSKQLLMPWDPGEIHNTVLCASLVPLIRVVPLSRPWDPGVVKMHGWVA